MFIWTTILCLTSYAAGWAVHCIPKLCQESFSIYSFTPQDQYFGLPDLFSSLSGLFLSLGIHDWKVTCAVTEKKKPKKQSVIRRLIIADSRHHSNPLLTQGLLPPLIRPWVNHTDRFPPCTVGTVSTVSCWYQKNYGTGLFVAPLVTLVEYTVAWQTTNGRFVEASILSLLTSKTGVIQSVACSHWLVYCFSETEKSKILVFRNAT